MAIIVREEIIWETQDNTRMDLKETECEDVDWIGSEQVPVTGSCEQGNKPGIFWPAELLTASKKEVFSVE
jgi:hypothetical protein